MTKQPAGGPPKTLDYGESISFGSIGTIAKFTTRGFDLNDGEHHSWTERQTAEIEFGLRLPSESVILMLQAVPFIPPSGQAQQVFVFLNGLLLGFITLAQKQDFSFSVERSHISSRQNRLTFIVPTAASPRALGIGDDQRQLGIALTNLSFIQE